MTSLRVALLIALLGSLRAFAPALAHEAPEAAAASGNALDAGLSRLHHAVSTRNRQVQAHFDQGMRLVFAFNHEAAIKIRVARTSLPSRGLTLIARRPPFLLERAAV